MGLREVLGTRLLIADGAMGTMLYPYGIDRCQEELNCSHPEAILTIHQEYIAAGVDIIQTNTYGANYLKLKRYGLEDQVQKINQAGVELARRAVGEREVFILGTIGGTHGALDQSLHEIKRQEIIRGFKEQLYTLILAGVDGILLETYYDFEELKAVLKIAREATKLPIVANVTLHEPGFLQNGMTLQEALEELVALGADVVGTNCLLGPHHMCQAFESVPLITGAWLSAFPNASFPTLKEGRIVYEQDSTYFSSFGERFRQQGIGILGGCCGTTPEHIRAYRDGLTTTDLIQHKTVTLPQTQQTPIRRTENRRRLVDRVAEDYTVLVELAPPRTLATSKFFAGAEKLAQAGVDAITLSDNSLASARISNLALAAILKYEYEINPLVHLTTRDHNLIGLNSQIMGLHKLGVHNVLAVSGDPAKVGDFPGASSVYDLSSFDLIRLLKNFNQGQAYTGKSLREKTDFEVGAALNINLPRLERAGRLLQKKEHAGADYFMTQPVFDRHRIKTLKEVMQAAKITIPVFVGVIPLVSSRNAEFLHNEVPGITLTDEIRERMLRAESAGRGKAEGLQIAKELIDDICEEFKGVYLMTPFAEYDLVVALTHYIKAKSVTHKIQAMTSQITK